MANNGRCEGVILQVREIARDLSGVSLETISENASFLELGFDSLFLTQLSASCQKSFGIKVTFRQLFNDLPTIAALGAYLDQKMPAEQPIAGGNAVEKPAMSAETTNVPVSTPVSVPPAPAIAPVLPVVSAQMDATASLMPVSFDEQSAAGIESVLVRQLELMTAQLRLLQGLPGDLMVAVPAAVASSTVQAAIQAPVVSPDVAAMKTAETSSPTVATETSTKKEGTDPKPSSAFGPGVVKSGGLPPLPAAQQKHLESLIERYTRKTAGSKERTQRHRSRLADPRTAAGFNRRWKEMVYPIWVDRSLGSKLWDVDGNEYIDLLNGF
ncbi:MAG TPA: phosphopantetheine-binding protein, partial [Terriglobales bacterium]|nr:phosphopantetheine-binding protein [Terriglobales bacterium]